MTISTRMAAGQVARTRSGVGQIVPANVTDPHEAMRLGGADFEVEQRPLLTPMTGTDVTGNLQVVKGHVAVCRKDNGAVLGVGGSRRQELQPWEMFDWTQKLVTEGLLSYETVGTLNGGQKVWLQAKFDETVILPEDRINKYLLMMNGFTVSSIIISSAATRAVCENTLMMAIREGVANEIRIRHTASMKEKLEAARNALGIAREQSHDFDMLLKAFLKLRMTGARWDEMANVLVPDNAEAKHNTRAENARSQLLQLAVTGKGQDIVGVAGTGYAAFNAITEYTNYYRSTRGGDLAAEKRWESTLFGSGNEFIYKGLDVLNGFLRQDGIRVDA